MCVCVWREREGGNKKKTSIGEKLNLILRLFFLLGLPSRFHRSSPFSLAGGQSHTRTDRDRMRNRGIEGERDKSSIACAFFFAVFFCVSMCVHVRICVYVCSVASMSTYTHPRHGESLPSLFASLENGAGQSAIAQMANVTPELSLYKFFPSAGSTGSPF
ncbi:hypothetical protein F4809DRAFT_348157 [Biscogniauxia mediterranea]|nr:hypothetical protein F4809DRAFT_348157 [Biscogniauxia mediterranea]